MTYRTARSWRRWLWAWGSGRRRCRPGSCCLSSCGCTTGNTKTETDISTLLSFCHPSARSLIDPTKSGFIFGHLTRNPHFRQCHERRQGYSWGPRSGVEKGPFGFLGGRPQPSSKSPPKKSKGPFIEKNEPLFKMIPTLTLTENLRGAVNICDRLWHCRGVEYYYRLIFSPQSKNSRLKKLKDF